MKLRHQLVTLSLGLSLLLILILGSLLALFIRHLLESNLQEKGSDLARVMAADTRVVAALRKGVILLCGIIWRASVAAPTPPIWW